MKHKPIAAVEQEATTERKPAIELLSQFLQKEGIVLNFTVQPSGLVPSGDGFVMADKPMLKIVATYQYE